MEPLAAPISCTAILYMDPDAAATAPFAFGTARFPTP